jgi:hypothetical protein
MRYQREDGHRGPLRTAVGAAAGAVGERMRDKCIWEQRRAEVPPETTGRDVRKEWV